MKKYHVVGMSHIDLGFVITEEELDECTEIFVERMLAVLDRDEEICFSIEQMSHYKKLLRDRPDLYNRVREYIKNGRIEIMGAMASTMETNFPNGECFIRNQKLGLDWAWEQFEVKPESAWLIDTFGLNAQIPQIYRQFGFNQVFANRFGADKQNDIFLAKGIDGTELLVIGRDAYSQNLPLNQHAFVYSRSWGDTERLFNEADRLKGDGPCLVTYYIENDGVLSMLYAKRTRERQNRADEKWILSTYHSFIEDLRANKQDFPILNADLNPEFTGTFALRTPIKQENRKTETLLLEAEKWSALTMPEEKPNNFDEAWWDMAFNHFHDVFTGSHGDQTYYSVMEKYGNIQNISNKAISSSINSIIQPKSDSITFVNGLPWERSTWVKIPNEYEGKQILQNTVEMPTVSRNGEWYCKVAIPATGAATYQIGGSFNPSSVTKDDSSTIGNEFLRIEINRNNGAYSLYLADGTAIIENALDYLTLQEDIGTLQVENPNNSEVFATSSQVTISHVTKDAMGETIILSGVVYTGWQQGKNQLEWSLEFRVDYGENNVKLHLETDWVGEDTRIRLNVPTTVNAADALYEIPFGVVERTSYRPRATAKGEWPAHRFVVLEDNEKGIALINTGVAGVEVSGRTLSTTLLRAHTNGPRAWVTPTPICSQHGKHSYDFILVPYKGIWKNAEVLRFAQETNNPILCFPECAVIDDSVSFASVDHDNIVFSSVKATSDNTGDLIIRYYESHGESTNATIYVKDALEAFMSDVYEICGEKLICENGNIKINMKPFEIQTIRIKR